MENESKKDAGFITKLATVIVDKRNLFFLLTVMLLIFSLFSRNWVEVENDLTYYLPDSSQTKIALELMDQQFTTYGTADVMVANISYDEAVKLDEKLEAVRGVQTVDFDSTTDHYNNGSALFSITFNYDEDDDSCLEALTAVKELLSGQDLYVVTDLGNQKGDIISQEINVIMIYVAVIVVTVLLLTSKTYGEVPVLLITFVTAMILNQGSNFLLGKISFVSNSVTSILQLALSLDYAIILSNHFKEAHETMPIREAAIDALSKSITEISASSLTTIGGLIAMMFMEFKLGADMSICLIKSILFSMLAVFIVMPGLLVLFGPLIEKSEHREFVPKISFVGKFAWLTRHAVPFLFLGVAAAGLIISQNCPYAYGYSTITTPKLNSMQISENMVKDNFTSSNMVALVVPAGDYDTERELAAELDAMDKVDYTKGLVNIDALDGYCLADKLTPRQFAELAGLDYETAELVYTAYAAQQAQYGELLGNISIYKVPLIDMFLFVCQQVDNGIVTLDEDKTELLQSAEVQMKSAKAQLCGTDYDRILVYLNLPVSGDETYAFTDTIREIAQNYYPDGTVYVVGNSTNEYDFEKSFSRDNLVVTFVSIVIVLIVLLFTFRSAGMPVLLVLVIQGSIWLNFSVPVFTQKPLFFIGYLVVTSIQMGANIDYAIVIASRYQELKNTMKHREAMIETLNFAFHTIITSGTILAVSGLLIGNMTSEATICGIGESLCRGTLISMVLVLFVLPQILLLGGGIVDRTSFSVPSPIENRTGSGRTFVDGLVTGTIHGTVNAVIKGTVDGDINLNLVTGSVAPADSVPVTTSQPDVSGTPDNNPIETAKADAPAIDRTSAVKISGSAETTESTDPQAVQTPVQEPVPVDSADVLKPASDEDNRISQARAESRTDEDAPDAVRNRRNAAARRRQLKVTVRKSGTERRE